MRTQAIASQAPPVTEPPVAGPEVITPGATAEMFEQAVRTHSKRMLAIARGIVGLLDGDTDRFDCPTLDGLVRSTAEGAGFTLALEQRPGVES